MADRNINESIRKPRRTKGTPFFVQRNYYTIAALGVAGLCAYIYNLWPETTKLKKNLKEGKFDDSQAVKDHFLRRQLAVEPHYRSLLDGLKKREEQREDALYYDQAKPEPCPPKLEKISKYFTLASKENTPNSSKSQSDCDDFKTPIAINKISKIRNKKPSNCTKKRKNIKKGTNSLKRFIETNMRQSDVNSDHLQLALALSESSYQAEHPEEYLSSQEKTESFRKAFEKFGFGYGKNRNRNGDLFEITKSNRNRKSRYRYVTPILKIRTFEQREELIKGKIDSILTYNNRKVKPFEPKNHLELFSSKLKKYHFNKIFPLNHLSEKELNHRFRINQLNLDWSNSCCGCLLKDWSKIQGRDNSPIREVISVRQESLDITKYAGRSISPDLFESDDEYQNTDLGNGAYRVISPQNSRTGNPTPNEAEFTRLENSFRYSPDGKFEKTQFETISFHQTDDNIVSPNQTPHYPEIHIVNHKSQTTNMSDYKTSENDVYDLTQSDSEDINHESYKKNSKKYSLSSDDETIDYQGCMRLNTPDEEILSTQLSLRLKYSFDENSSGSLTNSAIIHIEDDVQKTCNINNGILELLSSDEETDDRDVNTSEKELLSSEVSLHFKYSFDDEEPSGSFSNLANIDEVQSVKDMSNTSSLDQTELYEVNDFDLNRNSPKKCEKLSTNESHETLSQESIEISDEELNYSSNYHNIDEDLEPLSPLSDNPIYLVDAKKEDDSYSANETPKSNKDFIIKTKNITPMPNYDQMNTPQITKQLDKFGLKPLKRTKGVKMLKYIYDTTHPLVKDDDGKIVKKRKIESTAKIQIAEHLSKETDLIFERTQSKRIHSCRIPLHIVWYNFIANNPHIRESILFYEPLQLEVLHASLKEQGFKFNIQDLLRFLDRKCITIRTSQGAHHKKKS